MTDQGRGQGATNTYDRRVLQKEASSHADVAKYPPTRWSINKVDPTECSIELGSPPDFLWGDPKEIRVWLSAHIKHCQRLLAQL